MGTVSKDEKQMEELLYKWIELNEKILDDEPITYKEFKKLFCETFSYFSKLVDGETISRNAILLIKQMSIFSFRFYCPKGMTSKETNICTSLTDGLILAISVTDKHHYCDLKNGVIPFEIVYNYDYPVRLETFDDDIEKVMEIYDEYYQEIDEEE